MKRATSLGYMITVLDLRERILKKGLEVKVVADKSATSSHLSHVFSESIEIKGSIDQINLSSAEVHID